MKKLFGFLFLVILALSAFSFNAKRATPKRVNTTYMEIKVYHFVSNRQETLIDSFLQHQLLPSLHRNGINNVGVFKALANDTSVDKKIYVFTSYKDLKQWEKISSGAANIVGGGYIDAVYNSPAYTRIETILLKAFKYMPALTASKLTGAKSERVYELRSYEGASEKIFRKKVEMFNEGGEIDIFAKLGFNAVFYGEVVSGSKMPNLMYMTSFENMNARNEHWKSFSSDPDWKKLSGMQEYKNTVSHSDISYLRATDYSDL